MTYIVDGWIGLLHYLNREGEQMMMYEVSFVLPCLTGAASYAASVCTLRIRGIWILDISENQLPS